jgi:hypothetical protein
MGNASAVYKFLQFERLKVVPVLNWAPLREDVLGGGGVAVRILDLGAGWGWAVGFAFRPLCSRGGGPWYPLCGSLGGPRSRYGRGGEEKGSQPPPRSLQNTIFKTKFKKILIDSVKGKS